MKEANEMADPYGSAPGTERPHTDRYRDDESQTSSSTYCALCWSSQRIKNSCGAKPPYNSGLN
jgi:hypothetical protein